MATKTDGTAGGARAYTVHRRAAPARLFNADETSRRWMKAQDTSELFFEHIRIPATTCGTGRQRLR